MDQITIPHFENTWFHKVYNSRDSFEEVTLRSSLDYLSCAMRVVIFEDKIPAFITSLSMREKENPLFDDLEKRIKNISLNIELNKGMRLQMEGYSIVTADAALHPDYVKSRMYATRKMILAGIELSNEFF